MTYLIDFCPFRNGTLSCIEKCIKSPNAGHIYNLYVVEYTCNINFETKTFIRPKKCVFGIAHQIPYFT